jgi:type IV secretion system protein VirB4
MLSKTVKREESISRFINIAAHYDAETLLDKSGKLIQIIKIDGLDFVTKDDQVLNNFKNNRNNLLKSFSSEFAIYTWEIRRKSQSYPDGEFPAGYAHDVNEKYKQKIQRAEMFHAEHYFAIITKQPEGFLNKGFNFLKQLNYVVDKDAQRSYLRRRHQELCDVTSKVMSALSDYKPKLLSVYEKNNIQFSEPLTFISQLINFDKFPIPLEMQDASIAIPRKRLSFNHKAGVMEMRTADNRRQFGAVLAIKAYAPVTYAGMLDGLSMLKIEYVMSQSFRFYDRQNAKTKLRDQQSDMMQAKDESIRQTEQIDDAVDDTASGEVGYGAHHFTLVCYADTQEDLNKHVALIVAYFSDLDIACVREDAASECGFWAQLPGNFGYILRTADISTKNLASFISLHNQPIGKRLGNHWGDAVTVFETVSGSPYYFNFHYKDVGNFLIFGAMGSGKTVLVGFLILQSMKFGGKRVIFDKDRGLEIMVRALSGTYDVIKPGIPTGFNPCQLEDTPENRKFLSFLLRKMLSTNHAVLSESDIAVIDSAIDGMYRLDSSERQLCHMASFFGAKKKDSLRSRFDQWHSDGTHAWLFDNVIDSLNLNADIAGFDLSHILSDIECKTPALMYLTYRVTKALEGHRGMLFFDEGWLALNDEYFRELMNDWSRTPRKKNNIFGLATQAANDTAQTNISKSINESAFCKIFFPNPSADKKVYMDELDLSEHEYQLIKTMPDDQHYFLLNHGRSTNKQSVVVRVNLDGMDDVIAVISAREETLKLLDEILAEYGNDPSIWLPIFYKKRKGNS